MKDNAQFRESYHALLREATPAVVARLVEELHATGDITGMLRFLEHTTKTLGTEVDRKSDANNALPVFNFVFNNGGVQAQQVVDAVTNVIENATGTKPELPPVEEIPILDVAPRTLSIPIEPLKLDDIDALLGLKQE